MRLGGIYALEGVMNDKTSPQYHQPVLEALCAFVREKTIEKTASKDKPATDVQAAVTVIGRRIKGPGTVNLANVSIPVANLERADLGDADLSFATLTKANLTSANLSGADLESATLSGADLSDANLRDANLSGAKLSDANLRGAKLLGANLFNATLSGADLSSANLSGAKLTQTQLDGACGDANTAGRPQTTKAVLAAACSISADYANYRAHSARPARSPAVRETRRRRGWAAVPRNTPSLAPQRRGDWSDAPLTHVPPTCRRSFSNFSTAGTSHIRNWKWGFDRGVGRLGVVRHNLVQKSRDQDALWPKRQGFNVLATRKPML